MTESPEMVFIVTSGQRGTGGEVTGVYKSSKEFAVKKALETATLAEGGWVKYDQTEDRWFNGNMFVRVQEFAITVPAA